VQVVHLTAVRHLGSLHWQRAATIRTRSGARGSSKSSGSNNGHALQQEQQRKQQQQQSQQQQ
jgi:hypothetical protein